MSRFTLRLRARKDGACFIEPLEAHDAAEARTLAEMRMLLTGDFDWVALYEGARRLDGWGRERRR